jgi:aldehyde:ferredoxin oxidoreductase
LAAGYHGGYLFVDASTGCCEVRPLDESVHRWFVGGVGLGTWLLARETRASVEPLDPGNAIIFAASPLVGTPLTTSAKFAVLSFSPLTGRVCDALASSGFALALKRAGIDGLVITGARLRPSILIVESSANGIPSARWQDAEELWGASARVAEQRLQDAWGREWQIASIGPAGERRIPFANISHQGRHAGRGGLGAVLGSKNIKGVAVRGNVATPLADPDRTVAIARRLSQRSFGPATAKYRELGTVANLLVLNRLRALPTRNFRSSEFEAAEQLLAEDLGPARRVARNSCVSCTIGCEHIYAAQTVPGVRLEYESLFALGPLCGVSDPAMVLRAAQACDEAGLDTISTGATIAFLTECAELGLIDGRIPGTGRRLAFGDGESVVQAIGVLLQRRGRLGELLAMGTRRAAESIGGAAIALAPHVKGLELPGYDPRRLHAMALGFAVGTRGADHNRSGAYEADLSPRVDLRQSGRDCAIQAIETEDRAAILDSLILCKFLRGAFEDFYAEAAEILVAVTGYPYSAEDLKQVAVRIVNARKCLNQRQGWTAAEDWLPARFLTDGPSKLGDPHLTAEQLGEMIRAYYQLRGWDEAGRVPGHLRQRLGLDHLDFGVVTEAKIP